MDTIDFEGEERSRNYSGPPDALTSSIGELEEWMVEHEYVPIAQMQGSMSQQAVSDPAAFERANYMRALNIFDPYLR